MSLELSTIRVALVRTTGEAPHPGKNYIVNNAVDEIILTQKVSATNHEVPEFLGSDYDANDFYEVEKISLEKKKKELDWRKREFEY